MSGGVERLDPYGDGSETAWVGAPDPMYGLLADDGRPKVSVHEPSEDEEGGMALQLSEERRTQLMRQLEGFFLEEFDETLSAFRAGQLLDFVLDTVAPHVYNQAVQDARVFMQRKLDELDGEVSAPWPS